MSSYSKLKKIILEGDDFLVICHQFPDGDAIGSLAAVGHFLKKQGKNFSLVSKDGVPKVFEFLTREFDIINDFLIGSYQNIILLDNGDLHRTGFYERIKKIKDQKIINIDHHMKNDIWQIAHINYVDPEISSTCELLYNFFIEMEEVIDASTATAILTGIYNDTGGFQHSNTSAQTLQTVAKLLSYGAKLYDISANVSQIRDIKALKLWGVAMERMRINEKYQIAYSVLTAKDIEGVGASIDEVSGLVNILNTNDKSRATLLLYETLDGKIKGSLRTENNNINLSALANILGGGGHKKAAGFGLDGKIEFADGKWKVV